MIPLCFVGMSQIVTRKHSKTKESLPDFEAALRELETLVEQMERGELTLEESLCSFERGIELTRHCQRALEEAEQRVQLLTEKDGVPELIPLDDDTQNSSKAD